MDKLQERHELDMVTGIMYMNHVSSGEWCIYSCLMKHDIYVYSPLM